MTALIKRFLTSLAIPLKGLMTGFLLFSMAFTLHAQQYSPSPKPGQEGDQNKAALTGRSLNQKKEDLLNRVISFPNRLTKRVQERLDGFDRKLTRQSDKALSLLIRQEERLKKQLARTDSLAAHRLFNKGIDSLKKMRAAITSKASSLISPSKLSGEYFPYLDTLKTSLEFLNKGEPLSETTISPPAGVTDALAKVKELEGKLQCSEKIKGYLATRQRELRQQLMQYSGFNTMKAELDKMGKELYYYQGQIKGYKEILGDPSRIEEEAFRLLGKVPSFQDFMSKNGLLAAVFSPKEATSLKGLQTRETVNKLMKGQLGLIGSRSDEVLNEYIQQAREEMDRFKKQAEGEAESSIPGFKPNGQKSKSLWQKIEVGTDCRFTRNNQLLPSTGDFGLSVAYHLTKNGVVGVGGSWQIGLGKDLFHLHLTHEGIGLRSFLEYTIAAGFGIRGGWERNFRVGKINTGELVLLKRPQNWQQSALIGITKRMAIPLKVPVLKKKSASGSVQLLYDFFHESHVPATPALQLRVGMGL